MANTILNPTIIAKAAVRILDNELVMANRVYRGYEDEYGKKSNGYDIGDTVTIRKPNQFTVRSVIGATGTLKSMSVSVNVRGEAAVRASSRGGCAGWQMVMTSPTWAKRSRRSCAVA